MHSFSTPTSMCTLLCSALTLLSLSVRETKRLFETEFEHCFFFPSFFFGGCGDVVLCCDLVVCFCGVFVLSVRRKRRRKWKVQKLQCCSCGGVCFLAFDLKLLIDSPLSFFQFFAVSCAVLRAFFFFPHTEC